MRQIRKGTFETNSSSTHSLVMTIASEFDRWVKGELYYCNYLWSGFKEEGFEEGKLYPKDVVDACYEKFGLERDSYDFCTYDEFINTDALDIDTYEYTTPNGDVIKAIAKYGYDG